MIDTLLSAPGTLLLAGLGAFCFATRLGMQVVVLCSVRQLGGFELRYRPIMLLLSEIRLMLQLATVRFRKPRVTSVGAFFR